MAPWQLLLIFYAVVGLYISGLVCAAISLTGDMADAKVIDWIITFFVHLVIWPVTVWHLVKDALLLD